MTRFLPCLCVLALLCTGCPPNLSGDPDDDDSVDDDDTVDDDDDTVDDDDDTVDDDDVTVEPSVDVIIEPVSHDFGNLEIGCVVPQEFSIDNLGTEDVVLGGVLFEDLAGNGEMSLTAQPEVPMTLLAGTSAVVEVTYAPSDVEADAAALTVRVLEPIEFEVEAEASGVAHLGESRLDEYLQEDPPQQTFSLTAQPIPETIEVRLNSVPIFVGWTYDAAINAIVFDEDHVPENGDEIEIEYVAVGGC